MEKILTLENILGFIAVFAAIFGLYKGPRELLLKKREASKLGYDVIRYLMRDGLWMTVHSIELQMGFKLILGKIIKAPIIRFLLLRNDAYENLLDFTKGQRFLDVDERDGQIISISLWAELHDAKATKNKRRRISIRYFAFSTIGFIPIIISLISGSLAQYENSKLFLMAILVISSCVVAYPELLTINALKAAERIHQKFGQASSATYKS